MTRPVVGALTIAVGLAVVCEGDARAQVVIEQGIQVAPAGGAGPIQIPGLGAPRQFKSGTGRIRGRVVSAENGGPIRRAQVRLTGPDVAPKTALTDAEGRFEFRELPASRFSMQSTKSGYVSVQFGQTRPFESGKTIELADKQLLDGADISMPRGSVISGRLIDEFGDPIPDASISVVRQAWSNGRRRLMPSPARGGVTNDLGQFRVYGLPPGEYYVSATLRGPGVDVGLFDIEAMMSAAPTASASTASAPKSGYAATYYPGTANVAEAQKITVGIGQESSGIDFPLIPVRLARVSGVVVSSEGRPMEAAMVTATPVARELVFMAPPGSTRTAKDGTFVFNGLPPGDYTLQVRRVETITSSDGGNTMVFRSAMIGGGGDQESGSFPLTLGGEDVSNVLITTAKAISATGRIVFEGGTPPSFSSVRVSSLAMDPEGLSGGAGMPTVKEDGTFELKGMPGQRMIRASAGPGWTLKSVKLNGADVTDTGIEFKPGEAISGVEIELTSRLTAITGSVTAADNSRLKDYTLVIFSESPDLWRLPMTRWVAGTRPDQDGRFKVQNLPAGRYYVAAVEYIPQGEWGDPEILDRLKSHAKRMTLSDGGTENLDLKLVEKY